MRIVKTVTHLILAILLMTAQCAHATEGALKYLDTTSSSELRSENGIVDITQPKFALFASDNPFVNPHADLLQLGSGGAAASDENSSPPKWHLLLLGILGVALIAGISSSGGSSSANDPLIVGENPPTNTPADPLPSPPVTGDDPVVSPTIPIDAPADDIPFEPSNPTLKPKDSVTTDNDVVETIKDRDVNSPLRGVFLSTGLSNLERDATERSRAVDDRTTQLSFGYDQFVSDSLVLGALFNTSRSDLSTVNANDTTETDSISVFGYSSYQFSEQVDFAAYVGFGQQGIVKKRTIETSQPAAEELLTGETDASNILVGIAASKRFLLENQVQLAADLELDYSSSKTDAFVERSSTHSAILNEENISNSLQITLGTGISKAFSGSFGVIVPNLSLGVVFDPIEPDSFTLIPADDTQPMITLDGTPHDKVYGVAEFDIVWLKERGFQFFSNINSTFANKFEKKIGFDIGIRLEF